MIHRWFDTGTPAGRAMMESSGLTQDDLPAVVLPGATLKRTTPGGLAEKLGLSYRRSYAAGLGTVSLCPLPTYLLQAGDAQQSQLPDLDKALTRRTWHLAATLRDVVKRFIMICSFQLFEAASALISVSSTRGLGLLQSWCMASRARSAIRRGRPRSRRMAARPLPPTTTAVQR